MQDLKSFLRGYGTNKPTSPEEWAIQESKNFAPGMLVFCLDSIAAPPGLAQFSKKEVADQGETYRVKDMSVVVSMTDAKPLAVNITASAFDLRFLEQLMLEKARKAILDGRDFLYVAALPNQPLDSQQCQVLETMATTQYSQGGSRRAVGGDNGSLEPAHALLAALGVNITQAAAGAKHVLDIGNVCHLLFAPDGRQEDKNKLLMKASFQAMAGDPSVAGNEGTSSAPAEMRYEDVTPVAGAEAAGVGSGAGVGAGAAASAATGAVPEAVNGWSDPTQWVEPQVPTDAMPEAWQAPSAEIPFPAQAAQWSQPGMLDQAAAGFLNPDAPVQVPDSNEPPQAFEEALQATPDNETGMPRPMPFGSPRQSMTGFKALEDTGTFRKFDNQPSTQSGSNPTAVPDIQQAASMAFAASAASESDASADTSSDATQGEPNPWNSVPTGGATPAPFLPPPGAKLSGNPQQIRPQAIRPQGQNIENFQVETGIYQQFGAPVAKPTDSSAATSAAAAASSAAAAASAASADAALSSDQPLETDSAMAAAFAAEAAQAQAQAQAAAAEAAIEAADFEQPGAPPAEAYAEFQTQPEGAYAEPTTSIQAAQQSSEPAVDESKLSLFDRLNFKLAKVKTEGTDSGTVPAVSAPSQPASQSQEPAELFGWETPEDVSMPGQASAPLFQLQNDQPVDEWQSWDTPSPADTPVPPQQQEANLADALSGLMENQSSYDQPAAYNSSYTSDDFAQSPTSATGYESQPGSEETAPGWAEFQESFNNPTPSSFSDAAPQSSDASATAAATNSDGGWEEPALPDEIYSEAATAAADAQPSMTAMEALAAEPMAATEPAPLAPPVVPAAPAALAPPVVAAPPPAISASNPFLTPPAPPPPPPPPPAPEPEVAPEPVAETVPEVVSEAAATAGAAATEIDAATAAGADARTDADAAAEAAAADEPAAAPEPPPAPKAPRKPTAEEQAAVAAEMASFQKKLEQQLAKAAKKLNSRVEEIKTQVSAEMERLANESADTDKQSESVLADVGGRFTKQLEDVAEDVRLKISDAAANGRYTIKQLLTTSQTQIEEERNLRYEELREASKQFKIDTEALSRSLEKDMQATVNKRTTEVGQMVEAVIGKLRETGDGFVSMVEFRFERFKERMAEETNTVTALLDRSVNSMMDELEGTNEKSSDKLKSAKSDFEQTINYQVRTAELTLSRKTRQHLTLTIWPKVKERKEILRAMSTEMSHRFTEESNLQVNAQMQGLEASLNAAKGQLHNLVTECLSNIDSVGRNQQAGLEEIFKDSSQHIEKCTQEVTATLTSTEKQIQETEMICKKLAETSSVDADPQLTEVRNTAHTKVLQIKQQATSGLITTIDSGCDRLDQISQQAQADLNNMRTTYAQGARQASDNGLATMRDAIQEALAAIQAAREKYME